MASELLKKRLVEALKMLVGANPDLYHHWRGSGVGTKKQEPCVAIIQYARNSDVGDPFLKQILDALLRGGSFPNDVKHAQPPDLAGIGQALGLGEAREPDSSCHQFAYLVRGIAWTVDAEYLRRLASKPDSRLSSVQISQFFEQQTRQAWVSLKNAAACYDAAWRLSTTKVTGSGLDPTVAPHTVQDFMLKSRTVMTDVTYSTWNILHRLLNALRPVELGTSTSLADPVTGGHSNLLTVLFYDEVWNRGVLGPMRVCLAASDYPAVVVDPLEFGVTVLDDALQQSVRAGYRCCRTWLLSKGHQRFDSIHILPEFPRGTGIPFSMLGGGSAGGLLAAGMIITARKDRVDRRRTTTCAIPAIAGDDDTPLETTGVELAAVTCVPEKMFSVQASTNCRMDRVALVAVNKSEWEQHNAFSGNPKPVAVKYLSDLVTFLQGDTVCEEQLKLHADSVHQQWIRIADAKTSVDHKGLLGTKTDDERSDTHRFDCFIPPRFQVEGPLRRKMPAATDNDGETAENRELDETDDLRQIDIEPLADDGRARMEVPGTGDEALLALLKLSFLNDQNPDWIADAAWLKLGKSLVFYDRAGAGKTVTTFRLKHVLTGPTVRDELVHGSAPLVVRIEGSWPTDELGKPFATVRQLLVHWFAVDVTGLQHPSEEVLKESMRAVDYALSERRAVIIVDGFDQFSSAEQLRIQQLMTTPESDGKDHCRWIIASRQHSINAMPDLFSDDKWLRVNIEPFGRQQQDDYFQLPKGKPIGGRWLKAIGVPDLTVLADDHPDRQLAESIREAMNELLSLPMVLWMIRLLVEKADGRDNQIPLFQNLSELYLLVSHELLKRAILKTRTTGPMVSLAAAVRLLDEGRDELKLSESEQIELLDHVLSLFAFQMMLLLETNGDINPERYEWFEELCRTRYFRELDQQILNLTVPSRQKKLRDLLDSSDAQWKWAVKVLKTIELNHQATVEHHNDKGIAFRSRKMTECYAARYLTRYATPFDVFGMDKALDQIAGQPGHEWMVPRFYSRPKGKLKEKVEDADSLQHLCAWDFTTHDDWEPTWRLAIDMPLIPPKGADASIKADGDIMRTSLAALFLRPKPIPGRNIRPTELIYNAWHRFEIDDRLLRQRRFWISDRYHFGQDLPVAGESDQVSQEESRRQLRRKLGEALRLPEADSVITIFRDERSRQLRDLILQRRGTVLAGSQRLPLPDDASEQQKVLALWQQATSREKSLTFVQCPPQSWIDAFQAGVRSENPCIGWMGEKGGDDNPEHRVLIKPFFMQATTVPRWMYREFDPQFEAASLSKNKYDISKRLQEHASAFGSHQQHDDFPCICTTFFDSWVFAKWLGSEFRIPTECEWEHACRAGTKTDFHVGSRLHDHHANFANRLGRTTPVGLADYPCNAYGLFDVHGNVWEWCWDAYSPTWYQQRIKGMDARASVSDDGPPPGSSRVLRGGSWFSVTDGCGSGNRCESTLGSRSEFLGFRLCVE